MTTISSENYALSEETVISPLLTLPVLESADLFELANVCTACVSVLVESDSDDARAALYTRLFAALETLRERCKDDLSPYLVEQLIAGEKSGSCVPDCWLEAGLQVDYALALTKALMAGTLMPEVAKALTRLLHDMVWMLAEYIKEPYFTAH
jgi:hypothetical protein